MNNNRDNELASKLLEVEDRFRSITETSVDGIVTSDGNDQILSWNRGAERMFGYGKEIIGMPVTTIIPERYKQAHLDGMKRFLKTGKKHLIGSTLEIEAVRKDGTEFPIELSLSAWPSLVLSNGRGGLFMSSTCPFNNSGCRRCTAYNQGQAHRLRECPDTTTHPE
jgi:PAS domain S-box-containing protein